MDSSVSVCEEKVYSAVYRSHAEKLRNFLYYKCGDLDKAEDLMHDTFQKLWQKCAEILYEKVTGFLFTVANNLFLDLTRSEKVSLKFEKSQQPATDTSDPHFLLRTKEFQEKVEMTISSLPEGQREAFLLNRIDKMTYKEIAQHLDISETAVEKRITKALVKLREAIKEFKNFKI
ncbi:MAG: RNA polymerase sigma factor [Bacteroidota bacterium]